MDTINEDIIQWRLNLISAFKIIFKITIINWTKIIKANEKIYYKISVFSLIKLNLIKILSIY